ncbi:unnamed protein product, partial [Mesorhabditis belari]|uniref:Mediator of RNA polymerase II transcription subunit 17 n=1 Tax=Mesorhabditis belari TaxID=2138241 RepID=A0AAF3EZY0_9BILA
MYGHGAGGSGYSMGGGGPLGGANLMGRKDKGISVALEPYGEWKIQEIGYDGMEKFIQPESFADHVGKLARKIDWRTLVDSDQSYDNPNLLPEDELPEEEDDEEKLEDETEKEKKEFPPEVGPWHDVAKNLHESLQHINMMLDGLQVMQHLDYLKPLSIGDPIQINEATQEAAVIANNGKAFQWVWKRKALNEVQNAIEASNANRRHLAVGGEASIDETTSLTNLFFREIEELCLQWRIRKTGDHLYGALGYKRYGQRFEPGEIFDITRRSVPINYSDKDGKLQQTILQISVPNDLIRRSKIFVSIFKDDMMSKAIHTSDEANLEYMKVDMKQVDNLYWNDALSWAQETLICRDTFNQLATDAVHLKQRMSSFRDGVLIVALHDDYLLRIELKNYPFKAGDLPDGGDPYLNRALRQMIVNHHAKKVIRSQMFVEMPLTMLNEHLDMRGPNAFTQYEIDERAKRQTCVLEKLLSVASHQRLVKLTVDTLIRYQNECRDPQVKWRWLRCAPTNSQVMIHIVDPHFDFLMGRVTSYLQIDTDCVTLRTKDGKTIDCYRDADRLFNTLKYVNITYFLQAAGTLGKTGWGYHILHGNNNAIDVDGNPPTALLVQCDEHKGAPHSIPHIAIRKSTSRSCPMIRTSITRSFHSNFEKLPGKSFCRKFDNLCAILKD